MRCLLARDSPSVLFLAFVNIDFFRLIDRLGFVGQPWMLQDPLSCNSLGGVDFEEDSDQASDFLASYFILYWSILPTLNFSEEVRLEFTVEG